MATAGSRKIHEFSAHSTRTNCIRLGRNTAGLLVTGGDDFLVNVWTNGKAGAILSLQGHSSPVTSVSFDKKEESIFAGSEKATIKLFDLEGAKVVRTITGHRAAVTAVDVHSLGNFFASGSQDTNVKLWDRRARECTASYRGHAKGICMLQFSPDGKWVTSASDDCTVKVWDLAAGRDIATLSHTHPVTSLQFNPCEFVLATTCKDRCVRFWDLETFLVLDTLGPEATAARSCYFVPDGSTLLAAYQDSLKQYAYDPVATMKHIDVQWGHVVDLAIWNTSAVAASLNGPTVSVWCLEMDRAPKSALEMPSPQQNGTFPVSENEFRRSGARATKQPEQAASGIGNVHVVQRVSKSNLAKPSVPAVEPQADRALHGNENGHAHAHRVEVVDEALKNLTLPPKPGHANACTEVGASLLLDATDVCEPKQEPAARFGAGCGKGLVALAAAAPAAEPLTVPFAAQPPRSPQPLQTDKPMDSASSHRRTRDRPSSRGSSDEAQPGPSPEELLRMVESRHQKFMDVMRSRSSYLELVRQFWEQGDLVKCLQAISRAKDLCLAADMLSKISEGYVRTRFAIDMCELAVSVVYACLRCPTEAIVKASLTFLLLLLGDFGTKIVEWRNAGQYVDRRDVNADGRRQRLDEARKAFLGLRGVLEKICQSHYSPDTLVQTKEALSIIEEMQ